MIVTYFTFIHIPLLFSGPLYASLSRLFNTIQTEYLRDRVTGGQMKTEEIFETE